MLRISYFPSEGKDGVNYSIFVLNPAAPLFNVCPISYENEQLNTLISRMCILFPSIIINERHHFELYFLACNEIKAL